MASTTSTAPQPRTLPPLMRLTDTAAARLRHLYATAHAGQLLRISVTTRGCSGQAYDMTFVAEPGQGDEIVKDGDLTLLVDRKATLFLIGSQMDYQESDLEAGFVFRNPNEKGRCGCGESFHV
ncbi:HesB/IscA family protein [Acetobacter vaccinii]|uniref:Iron-sulfur cluster assembly accessory protein n=1 Tax=Acetobacter vaccinii TaxID=2592655 RepID=A0A5C1YR54_9PROT|nr:iron-sulfur cluster assembly accessory protein [Acetobacter vaccinii]QEO18078.1 iron-sulfur cluster assembly accessory protein [Acetobacter vaccinii]